ncbi:MAG: flagellar basal body L-ring protein FlgH [Ignavibacteriales bacterium]|nr:flagellar basal body L-ring protein FlgH [Ignavibacteriales bacterium]
MLKILIFIFVYSGVLFGQDMRSNVARSLFSDHKAYKVGDAITVIVLEVSSAITNASTSTERASDVSLDASGQSTGLGNIPQIGTNFGLGTGNTFSGGGSVQNRGDVRATISATVDSVLQNGNLHIYGTKSISIRNEDQTIELSGIVRPSDIRADNSVLSINVSEAVIIFSGSGMVDRAREPGWLTKIFHWIF